MISSCNKIQFCSEFIRSRENDKYNTDFLDCYERKK